MGFLGFGNSRLADTGRHGREDQRKVQIDDDQMPSGKGREGFVPAAAAQPAPGVLSFSPRQLNAMIKQAVNKGPAR